MINGTWNRWWFEPEVCNIRRVSTEEACGCFRGKTIGLIGDSTIGDFWKQLPAAFGEMRKFGPDFDISFLEQMRQAGDMRLYNDTTHRKDSHNFQFRHWALWRMEMWSTNRIARDNANHTIASILQNTTHDLIMLNIGSHHMSLGFKELVPLLDFYTTVDDFVRNPPNQTQVPPTIFLGTNAHYGPKKRPSRKHQNHHYSRVVNELAHYAFELEQPQKIPMIDFTGMMEAGFPWSSRDGVHCPNKMDDMKVRTMVSLLCPEGGTLRTYVPE